MGIDNRDYVRGEHPIYCTCVECFKKNGLSKNKNVQKPISNYQHYSGDDDFRVPEDDWRHDE